MAAPTVDQLIVGTFSESSSCVGKYNAVGTVVLIRHEGCNILVDTGGPNTTSLLKQGLEKHGLTPNDVTHVVCTHGHIDHVGNLALFQHSNVILDGDIYYSGGLYATLKLPHVITDKVQVEKLPGHTDHDLVVFVSGTERGTVCAAGDIFEHAADLSDEKLWSDNSRYVETQRHSRQEILKRAQWIIPGHGRMFEVKL